MKLKEIQESALGTFPYHWIDKESAIHIRFLVLRHDKRHPGFGLRRR